MKIEEQVLSREQMAHLEELGVDTSDASMVWVVEKDDTDFKYATITINNRDFYGTEGRYNFIPTYTIGELIEKLPKQIGWYALNVNWDNDCIEYKNWISEDDTEPIGYFTFRHRSFIEALCDCLCWVAENHKELIE